MNTFKLVPQFRDNCAIQGPQEWLTKYNDGDTIFLIKDLPTKSYSIITKIDGIRSNTEPIIYIDQRIMGNFGEGEEVSIQKYHPALAREVHISISDEFSTITKGDWTSVVASSLKDKLIDYGREVTFSIPWEGGAPIVATGIIDTTLPNPPLVIGDGTKIYINKLSSEELSKINKKSLKTQSKRVKILQKQIEQKTIDNIRYFKQNNFPNKGQKYDFKGTNPKKLFNTVLQLFKGLETIEDPVEKTFGEEEQDFLASCVFLKGVGTEQMQIIDVQVTGSQNKGALSIYVTGKDETIISSILEEYDVRVGELKQGLEQKIEIVESLCPGCGADLPTESIDIDGNVKCIYCRKVSKIPKILRY